jgi:ribosomal protein L11 methyltransferase
VAGDLWALGATAIEERGVDAGVLLVAAFPTASATKEAADAVGGEVVEVEPGELVDRWRDYAEPVDVGAALRVVPAWRPAPTGAPGRLDLLIDPGPCFGSGSHPTTRAMLMMLEDIDVDGAIVLDVGTGSGILAVAAARRGAARVEAIDIDPAATAVVSANAGANGVGDVVRASAQPLAAIEDRFDVVLANLSAATLVDLGADLIRVTAPGGVLALSGMLTGQWRHVRPGFAAMTLERRIDNEGWATIMLRAPGTD